MHRNDFASIWSSLSAADPLPVLRASATPHKITEAVVMRTRCFALAISASDLSSPILMPPSATRLSARVRLCDENRDPPRGPRLVVRVGRKRRHGEPPEPRPFRFVLYLTRAHPLNDGMIAELDGRIGAKVIDPHR